ncbi:hypothetical protein M0R04_14785 [Candidatus Dojkabacteria bacterium]|nr:hypothetical protein [Candidatus Dojkabacteria bacterium]
MNRKGLFGMIFIFIALIVVTTMVVYQSNPNYEYKYLNWTNMNATAQLRAPQSNVIADVAFKIVDTMGYCVFTLTNASVDWAKQHPQLNWKLFLYLILFAFILYIIVPLIKVFLILGIFIKDLFQSRKEAKRLKELRARRDGK